MSATLGYTAERAGRSTAISGESLRESIVWLAIASSFFVMFEPAAYDLLMIGAVVLFAATGLKLPRALLPFLLLVILYQIGALLTLTIVFDRANTQKWTTVGVFLAITGCFYALFLAERTEIRAKLIANAWVVAGVASGLFAILGYFHLVPFADTLLKYNRAKGFFKDPNVFAPHLIFPALVLMQQLYWASIKRSLIVLAPLGIVMAGILLSFSRGSWGHLIASAALMTVLTVLSAPSRGSRARILVTCLMATLAAAAMVVVIVHLPSVSSLFAERASLEQSYDTEHGGRFSNHLAGFQLALEKPLGIGIFQFSKRFGADVHNTYLNAFMSYGWLGGIVVPVLTILTLVSGFRTVLIASPWRPIFICTFSTWTVLMIEAAVIDVDHWRHQWALLGMTWGFIAANIAYRRRASAIPGPATAA
ncbi:O-antigen ligase family protein [Hansschlegelia quercus]|uniref:O-antigen ligase family protein n=1 Tax=Hansschlegelia quercus TaxID=2528245 RepID=UPI001FE034FA|nr:O-antigen ligase family protein [Hansschlegelia quercus]